MKKFISAATCVAMAASMVSVAAPAVNAADATKTITLAAYSAADSAYASMGSNIKVSNDDITAGDVTVPVAIYLTEQTNDSEVLTLPVTIKSKDGNDVSGISFKAYNATEAYFSKAKSYKTKSGVSFSTKAAVPFDGTVDDMDEYTTYGTFAPVTDTKQEAFGISTPYYCASKLIGSGYEWLGENSDDYPVAVFDIVLPKGTAQGDYSVEFCDFQKLTSSEKESLCNIATKDKTTYDNIAPGAKELVTNNMTISVGDSKPVSTTSTSEEVTTTSTVSTTQNIGDGDITLDFGEYEVEAGNSVSVNVKLAAGDVAVAGMDVFYQIDSPLTITGFGGSAAAYNATIDTNKDKLEQNFFAVGSDGEPVKGEVGESVFKCKVAVPEDCPSGDYKISFKSIEAYKSGQNSDSWDVNVIPGVIHVTNPNPGVSTTTSEPTETTTTTTATTSVGDEDLVLDFGGEYEGEKGGSVNVTVKLADGDVAVAGMDVFYQIDSPLTITGFGGSATAYNATIDTNKDKLEQNFFAVGSDGEPVKGEVGEAVFKCKVSIPEDCPDGEYTITFKSIEAYKSGQNSDSWNVKVIPATIKVGNPVTTTTSETETTTTTTVTTTEGPTPELTPAYGDTNCDGLVNIADVVVLNRHLADKTGYPLTDQAKLNADVYDAKGGAELTAEDSTAIIRHIIHLPEYKTLPVDSSKL
jgi:hypothetical protein